MSFSLKKGLPIAKIKGGSMDGKIIYLDKDSDRTNEGVHEFKINDGCLIPFPNLKQHEVFYVAGPAGSGKTTYVANYVKLYKKAFPDKDIFVVSSVQHDRPLDELGVKRIDVNDPDLLDDPLKVEEFRGALVIFDDFDSIDDKEIRKEIFDLMEKMIKKGRLHTDEKVSIKEAREGDIDVIVTSHQIYNYKATREILNEATSITVFPSSGSSYQIENTLKRYLGLSKKQIQVIMNLPTRAVTIYKRFPQYCLSDHALFLLKELN